MKIYTNISQILKAKTYIDFRIEQIKGYVTLDTPIEKLVDYEEETELLQGIRERLGRARATNGTGLTFIVDLCDNEQELLRWCKHCYEMKH